MGVPRGVPNIESVVSAPSERWHPIAFSLAMAEMSLVHYHRD